MPTWRDYQRWARKGTTTQRGYGGEHQRERKRRLAMWRPGDPCVRCGQPIWAVSITLAGGSVMSLVDLGHSTDRSGYVGLEHRRCNRGDGARRRNAGGPGGSGGPGIWPAARRW
jgi:hypothetical protein